MSGARQLAGFLAAFDPAVAAQARAALARLRKLLPGANQLVYDNYNALAIGFGPTERASEIVLSIAVFPRWVSLFLMRGPELPDPKKLLRGSGTRVRHIVLESATRLDEAAVRALIAHALKAAPKPIDGKARGRIIVKSISARKRPRRPSGETSATRRGRRGGAGSA